MTALSIISVFLLTVYVALILCYYYFWQTIPETYIDTSKHKAGPNTYTIIIPARNEESVIEACLDQIYKQSFPKSHVEVTVIDDHSTDTTALRVQQWLEQNNDLRVNLITPNEQNANMFSNKKEAIMYAIEHSKSKYIALTDADCGRGPYWLAAIDAFVSQNDAVFVYAPVEFTAHNMFQKIQSLEFAGLVGIGAAAIQSGYPNMCSASNLLFKREAFHKVGGYRGNSHIASGDDEFLLHRMYKYYPRAVFFAKIKQAIVHTSANSSIGQLASQRRRWVSKSTKYENRYITAILVAAYLFNLLIVVNLFVYFKLFVLMIVTKTAVEGLFLYSITRFMQRARYMIYLPLAEPFHIMYVLIIGIWANITTYQWKGRTHK
jgi:cellulose synthase/poly-beta-1,6-N-acetylglucosamine synthase-like glycosyltransferase